MFRWAELGSAPSPRNEGGLFIMEESTRKFKVLDHSAEIREILSSVYNSLIEKGYNPINQIVGYILSEDPTYITNYNNARALICRLDRDELLQELVTSYLQK
jgi:uncharacterized protein (UPF0297 family)